MYAQDNILCQFGLINLSSVHQLISQPILVHFWWELYHDYPTDVIDYVPDSPHGGIDLPPDEFNQIHAISSRHPPSPRPGSPSRPPYWPQQSGPQKAFKRYNGPIYLPPQIYKLLSQDAMKSFEWL